MVPRSWSGLHRQRFRTRRGQLGIQCVGRKISAVRSGQRHSGAHCNRPRPALFHAGQILEGGSIEVNGQGTLITTESCLLNPNRNLALDRAAIEQQLRDYLGVRNILWLGDGIVGDDTDGHVDDLTRFVDTQTVVTAVEPDPQDPNHVSLQANLERLQAMRTEDGSPLRVIELPMPETGAASGRTHAGQLREFLHRQPHGVDARLRPAARCRRTDHPATMFPGPPRAGSGFLRSHLGPGLVSLPYRAGTAGFTIIPAAFWNRFPRPAGACFGSIHPMSTVTNSPASSTPPPKRRFNINRPRWKTPLW